MTQDCNCKGVKITDLDSKETFTGNEYVVVAEKQANYKIPMSEIGNVLLEGDKFTASVESVYTSDVPVATVKLKDNEFKFSFGIPAGEKGDRGRDGIDGINGIDGKDGIDGLPGIDGDSTRVVTAYKSTETMIRPATPVGGSWDPITNKVIYPEGWSGNDSNPNGFVWQSLATFSSKGTIVVPWSDPIRLTGADGQNGVDGVNIEFVYKLTVTNLVRPKPDHPVGTQEDAVRQGWTDHPMGISELFQCEWVSQRTKDLDSGVWSEWQPCVVWSKWGVTGQDGDGVEYIFQRTATPIPPKDITDNNPDQSEYIPQPAPGEQPWTDDPTGVNQTYQWEWVSQRKYKGSTKKWSNFTSPALWAKYSKDGVNGQDGLSIRVMYTKTADSDVKPADPIRLNINPGSVWGVGMPTATGKEAIWAIQSLVTFDNQLYIDTSLPENERGWQGPACISGVPGLDATIPNYQIDAYKQSDTQPEKPTSNDPNNPGNGWILNPDLSNGTWWKCTANVLGATGTVIAWGAVIKVTGSSIRILGVLTSVDDLPTTGNTIGDGWIINGNLWTWNGNNWVNTGKIQGPNGNYTEYRFARNDSFDNAPTLNNSTRNPSGWSVHAPAKINGKVLWQTYATINGADGSLIGTWADPYYITGDQGASGIPGVSYENRYCVGTETTYTATWNDTVKNTRDPSSYGWSLTMPTLASDSPNKFIWFIQTRIINDLFDGNNRWSDPNPMAGIITPDPTSRTPILYPEGMFKADKTYYNDGVTAPYVWDPNNGKVYWLSKVDEDGWNSAGNNNTTPATDSASWTEFTNYEAVTGNIGIFGNALIGGAVFNGNLMFSLRGKNASNADTSNYENINIIKDPQHPADPDFDDTSHVMDTTNSFRPNFMLDFRNGEAYFGAGGIHLAADSLNSSINIKSGSNNTTIDKNGIDMTMGDTKFTANSEGILYKKGNKTAFGVTNTGAGTFADGNFVWNLNGDVIISNGLIVNTDGTGLMGPSITWDAQGLMEMNKSLKVINADSDYNIILGKGPTTDTTALTITNTSGTKIAEIGLVKTESGSVVVGFGYTNPNNMDLISLTAHGLTCRSGSSGNYSGFSINSATGLLFFGSDSGWKTYAPK